MGLTASLRREDSAPEAVGIRTKTTHQPAKLVPIALSLPSALLSTPRKRYFRARKQPRRFVSLSYTPPLVSLMMHLVSDKESPAVRCPSIPCRNKFELSTSVYLFFFLLAASFWKLRPAPWCSLPLPWPRADLDSASLGSAASEAMPGPRRWQRVNFGGLVQDGHPVKLRDYDLSQGMPDEAAADRLAAAATLEADKTVVNGTPPSTAPASAANAAAQPSSDEAAADRLTRAATPEADKTVDNGTFPSAAAQPSLDEAAAERSIDETGDTGGGSAAPPAEPPAAAQGQAGPTPAAVEDPLSEAKRRAQEEIKREFAAIMATGTARAGEAAALATRRVMQRHGLPRSAVQRG